MVAEALDVALQLGQERFFSLFRGFRFRAFGGGVGSVVAHFLRITNKVMSSCCGWLPTNARRSSVIRVMIPAAPSDALAWIALMTLAIPNSSPSLSRASVTPSV